MWQSGRVGGLGPCHMTTVIADSRACRTVQALVSRGEITVRSWPIQPTAGNAGIAPRLAIESSGPGAPEPDR